MHILKVVQSYYPFQERGGTAVKVRALARGLARRGHHVTVLTADLGLREGNGHAIKLERCDVGWRFSEDGVDAIYLPTVGRYRALTLNPHIIGFCRASLGRFDLAHFYGLYDLLGPLVSYFCRRQGVPYVIEPMGMYRPIDRSFRLKHLWHNSLGRSFWRYAAQIVATSELEQRELLNHGVPCERIALRYNGIDPEAYISLPPRGTFRGKWGIPPEDTLILFLSRLIPRKGADVLIEAFAEVWTQSAWLVVAGPEGERGYRSYLEKRATERGLGTRILFTGPLYNEQKWAAMADTDLFVLPSRYENFANAPAEAIACGIPVIITDACGIASLVEGRAGLVIPPQREALTEALRKLMDDKALYVELKEGCPELAGELGWDRLAEQMEGHYGRALAKRFAGQGTNRST